MKHTMEPWKVDGSMEKQLSTLGVMGVVTGRLLKDGGFHEIHETMGCLYPGIMTLGCARMLPDAQKEVLRQHPEFSDLPPCTETNYEAWAADALERFGTTVVLAGPVSFVAD